MNCWQQTGFHCCSLAKPKHVLLSNPTAPSLLWEIRRKWEEDQCCSVGGGEDKPEVSLCSSDPMDDMLVEKGAGGSITATATTSPQPWPPHCHQRPHLSVREGGSCSASGEAEYLISPYYDWFFLEVKIFCLPKIALKSSSEQQVCIISWWNSQLQENCVMVFSLC